VSINPLAKVYGLGAPRVGWLIAAKPVVDSARDVVNLLNSDNPAPSEALAVKAFSKMRILGDRFRRFYNAGQEVFRDWLANEPLVAGYPSNGALFECVRLPEGVSSDDLNDRLVAAYDTQVVPGSFFGLDDHMRLNTAFPSADLGEALHRISLALRSLAR
jgi:aspartate/methionine/tyrosine aminotransferase